MAAPGHMNGNSKKKENLKLNKIRGRQWRIPRKYVPREQRKRKIERGMFILDCASLGTKGKKSHKKQSFKRKG
jgi:hypothetical protein